MRTIVIGFVLFILALFINCCLMAQLTVQNNGIVYISTASSTFYVNGPLVNASTAALTNNGNLYVKQDLTNNQASMAIGTGTLYLNGSSTQTVAGAQTFNTYNLVTNNSNGFILNNNLSISGAHTFTSGNITTSSSPNFLVYQAGASYTGDGDTRHVDGWVKKFGNSDFIFPVGNSTYERTIALTNLTTTSEFNVRHYDGITPNRLNLFAPIVLIDTNEYWTISKISGGSANVAMNWDNAKIPVPQVIITGIRAGYYDGSFWMDIGGSATGAVATTGTVTSNSVSAFNNMFTIASKAVVLPLSITSFTGKRNNAYNQLNWTISNEINELQYELQSSNDAVNFTTINIQKAKNNNDIALYSYDDVAGMQSKMYYRLRCIDNNGQIKYSSIVIIATQQNDRNNFYVIKNPVQDRIDIYAGESVMGTYAYSLTGSTGQTVQAGSLDIKFAGTYTIKLQQQLASGIYILTVRNGQNILQKTILKE